MADLRAIAVTLAQQLDLPRVPTVKIGYVPWSGPTTPVIESLGIWSGHFTIARWAVRGKYRRSMRTLEYEVVCAVGSWLEAQRAKHEDTRGVQECNGTHEALNLWYGPDEAATIIAAREHDWKLSKKGIAIWLGVLGFWLLAAAWLKR